MGEAPAPGKLKRAEVGQKGGGDEVHESQEFHESGKAVARAARPEASGELVLLGGDEDTRSYGWRDERALVAQRLDLVARGGAWLERSSQSCAS